MSEVVVANRYADALFQLAVENNNVKEIVSELAVVKDVFKDNSTLSKILNHPQVKNDEKMKLMDLAFGKCDKNVQHTLKLLVERHRIEYIVEIIEHFTEKFNEANGIAVATVISARELSANELTKVEASLVKQLHKKEVSIKNVIDPSVLGGLKIRVGNTIYDGSISGKLNRMKHNIGAATI